MKFRTGGGIPPHGGSRVTAAAGPAEAKEPQRPHTGTLGATIMGCGAIILWATLAPLTVLKGPIPPFQTTALTFGLGAALMVASAVARGRTHLLAPTLASLALGIYGLFGFHALYFAALRLAPPAEAHLLNSLWSLLIVLLSALLPDHRLSLRHVGGALLGFAAAALLVWNKIGSEGGANASLGFLLAIGCAVIWSTYSVASRIFAAVATESLAAPAAATALLAATASLLFETWVAPAEGRQWLALILMGLGPVGGAFLMWDIGMKKGRVATLGVLSYASPVLSTVLLVVFGLSQGSAVLWLAVAMMTLAGAIATR